MTFRWTQVGEQTQGALFPEEQLVQRHVGVGAYAGTDFLLVDAGRVVTEVPAASRMPFRFTINPYRGCTHACTYCFARPTHEYLGLGIGDDFDRQIVVKRNCVERARTELDPRRGPRRDVALGTNTDPYQSAEGKYHLTRGLIQVFAETGTNFSILTKSTLVLRDLDVLADAAKRVNVRINMSIRTFDRSIWRATEPGTPPPDRRMQAVARLNAAGIRCGVLMAPILPFLSDDDEQLHTVVKAAQQASAVAIAASYLYLRSPVREHFLERLGESYPEVLARYEEHYRRHAYRPAPEQRELSTRVRRMAAQAGPSGVRVPFRAFVPPRHAVTVPTLTEANQLALL